jgi:lipopolysaccharide export system permease protein
MFLTTRLGRYLLVQNLIGFAIVAAGITAAIGIVDLVEQIRTFAGRPGGGIATAVTFTALRTPLILEQALPFVILFGVAVTFMQLSRRSEVTAMRAAGVSAWQFLTPTAVLAGVFGLIASTTLNPLATALNRAYEEQKAVILDASRVETKVDERGVWLRQGGEKGQIVIRARAASKDARTLTNATFFVFATGKDGAPIFERRLDTPVATVGERKWILRDAVENVPGGTARPAGTVEIAANINARLLLDQTVTPRTTAFWALPEAAAEVRSAGLSATAYDLRWHRLLALPLTLIAMAVLAAVFSLGLERFGNQAASVGLAAASGLAVYFANDFAGAMASADVTPAAAAAWCPPVAALAIACWAISVREDG